MASVTWPLDAALRPAAQKHDGSGILRMDPSSLTGCTMTKFRGPVQITQKLDCELTWTDER